MIIYYMKHSTIYVESVDHYSGMMLFLELARNFYRDMEKYQDKSKVKKLINTCAS